MASIVIGSPSKDTAYCAVGSMMSMASGVDPDCQDLVLSLYNMDSHNRPDCSIARFYLLSHPHLCVYPGKPDIHHNQDHPSISLKSNLLSLFCRAFIKAKTAHSNLASVSAISSPSRRSLSNLGSMKIFALMRPSADAKNHR
jgi:hypothetical protein